MFRKRRRSADRLADRLPDVVDSRARSRAMPVERRAVGAVLIAVGLWSATSLFVRAGHSDALVFTTWRLVVRVAAAGRDRRAGGRSTRRRARSGPTICRVALDRVARRRGRVLRRGRGDHVRGARARPGCSTSRSIGSLQPVLIIGFAVAFLGEHVARTHLLRAAVAIAGRSWSPSPRRAAVRGA